MASPYIASAFLQSMKRRGKIPASSDRSFSTDDLLGLATEELQGYISQLLMSVREEYLVADYNFTTDGSAEYKLPPRAIGAKLRQVWYVPSSGSPVPVARIEPKAAAGITSTGSSPVAFYAKRNSIVLVPTPGAGVNMRQEYFLRPSSLVYDDQAGEITNINTGTNTVTLASMPLDFVTGATYDFISAREPSFDLLGMDYTGTVSGSTLIFSSLPTGLAVGDYVAFSGQSPIPQIPVELHALLSQRTVYKVLEASGDPKASVAEAACERERTRALEFLTPRSQGDGRFVINYHGPGWRRWLGW